VRPWDSLSEDEKRLMRRQAEVYAGYSSHSDHELGRVIDYLEETGELENTLIVWLSDNGASGEGGPNGSVNENNFFNGVPDDMAQNLEMVDKLGSPETYNHYSTGRAMAFTRRASCSSATPGRAVSRTRWSCTGPTASQPGVRSATSTRTAQTFSPPSMSASGSTPPAVVNGYTQWPLEGTSFKYSFDDASAATQKPSQFYVMLGTRSIWRDGWKAVALHAGTPAGWSHFSQDRWALYHVQEDRSECHDLADEHPELLQELIALWHYQAGQYFGLPLEDRTAIEVLTTPRPQMSPPRDRYIYYPGTLEVPEAVAVNIRGRSYKIAAELDIHTPEAGGVIFAHGHKFGGHALYLKEGKVSHRTGWDRLDARQDLGGLACARAATQAARRRVPALPDLPRRAEGKAMSARASRRPSRLIKGAVTPVYSRFSHELSIAPCTRGRYRGGHLSLSIAASRYRRVAGVSRKTPRRLRTGGASLALSCSYRSRRACVVECGRKRFLTGITRTGVYRAASSLSGGPPG
jgi:hypothetical protein